MLMLYSLSPQEPLKETLTLNPSGSIRLALTVTNGGKPRKPHQAFLTLSSSTTALEESFPFTLSDNGKAKFDLVGFFVIIESPTHHSRLAQKYPQLSNPELSKHQSSLVALAPRKRSKPWSFLFLFQLMPIRRLHLLPSVTGSYPRFITSSAQTLNHHPRF
jgi:hypothetical protein